MTKQLIKVYVNEEEYNDDDVPVQDFLEMVMEAIKAGATNVQIESEYDSGNITMNFYYKREETDQELAKREKAEKSHQEYLMNYKREQYERLKKELGE